MEWGLMNAIAAATQLGSPGAARRSPARRAADNAASLPLGQAAAAPGQAWRCLAAAYHRLGQRGRAVHCGA